MGARRARGSRSPGRRDAAGPAPGRRMAVRGRRRLGHRARHRGVGEDPAPGPARHVGGPTLGRALPSHRRLRRGPDVRLILYLCISEAIRASGLLPLHAAVVVRDGWATALAAPSGTGKSTTLLRCLSRGWNPLAEDLAWLDPTTLRVYGWDRGVRLWDDGVRRLPSPWREAPWRVDPDGKRFLPWSEVRPERLPSARLEKIVLLERSGDDDGAGPPRLPPHEAVRVAWEAAGVPLNERARSASNAAIQLLLQQVEFERLTIEGGSPLSFSVPLL